MFTSKLRIVFSQSAVMGQLFDTTQTMKKESIYTEISNAVQRLLKLARDSSFNDISDDCMFIISEIKHSDKNFFEQYKIRKLINDKKTPKILTDMIGELESLYANLYDVNLYVYCIVS
jgi:hypothetical protein